MTTSEFLAELATVLQKDPMEVTESYSLKEGVLDSMAVLEVIALIDRGYGVTLPADKLSGCRSVGEILSLIKMGKGS